MTKHAPTIDQLRAEVRRLREENDRLRNQRPEIISEDRSKSLIELQGEMLEASHDAMIAWELDGGITFWNRGAELLYGFSKQETIGKSTHEILRTEHPIPFQQIAETLRQTGDWEGNLIHYTKQDRPLRVVTRHQLMRFEDSGKDIVLEVNRDITDFELLSRQVAQLASIIDLTTDFVGTADVDGKVAFINRGGAEMLGYASPEELRDKVIADFHPEDSLARLQSEGLTQAATGKVWIAETEMLSRTGERIPVSQVVMAHFHDSGAVTHYSTIARDISEQKSHQRELEAMRDAAESANRAKSAFLAQMSHEIRTPMTAIVGCAEQLQQKTHIPENQQLSRILVEQGEALMAILDDVLDLSRIEADRVDLEIRETDVPRILRDLYRLMKPRADEIGLELNLELVGSFPKRIDTDAVRLRQVIVNLLSNAFKFTPQGSVTLRSCCVNEAGAWSLRVAVIDSGIGIADEKLKSIFEAFTRLQESDVEAPGTGLGLTIAHRLTSRLGGNLEVQSRVGTGTTFEIALPIASPDEIEYWIPHWSPADEDRNRDASSTDSRRLPIHVLVAEDTAPIRFLLEQMLQPLVEKLTFVENGRDAVDATSDADHSIDLILMDMQMPVMSGSEATQAIRRSGNRVPIIALTAGAMDADRRRCLEIGCNEFLSKPIDRRRLTGLVEQFASRKTDDLSSQPRS